MTNRPVYMVCGSKGGVGKSLVAMAAAHYFQSSTDKVLLIETDTSNPDVAKACPGTHIINLDTDNGWIDLINLCEQYPDHVIVINTAARNNIGVEKYGALLQGALVELKRPLVTLWVINPQRDSLELLRQYRDTFPFEKIHVIRNEFFGEESRFDLYNNSKIKKEIEAAGGKSLTFPVLASRLANSIYTDRISIKQGMHDQPLGNRMEMIRWVNKVNEMMRELTSE